MRKHLKIYFPPSLIAFAPNDLSQRLFVHSKTYYDMFIKIDILLHQQA